MTEAMVSAAQAAVPSLSFEGWTSHDGPPAIQGAEDGALAEPPLLELGELPHLLILTIVMVAALFAIAWLCMLWYHTNRPPKLRTEIARLNSEVSEA